MNRDKSKDIVKATGSNTSSILIINHIRKRTIRTVEEAPKYTIITFISDVGGILGIFLGFSFWSIHSAVIAPLVNKFESNFSNNLKLTEAIPIKN